MFLTRYFVFVLNSPIKRPNLSNLSPSPSTPKRPVDVKRGSCARLLAVPFKSVERAGEKQANPRDNFSPVSLGSHSLRARPITALHIAYIACRSTIQRGTRLAVYSTAPLKFGQVRCASFFPLFMLAAFASVSAT